MDKDYIKKLAADPDFIPGIYNYCDRWCQRCPFTLRCMNYALSEEQFSEPGSRDILNQLFWKKLSEAFRMTRELLEDALKDYGIDLESVDIDAAEQKERERQETSENHECTRAAKSYGRLVDGWFKANDVLFAEKQDDIDIHAHAFIEDMNGLDDSVEIIHWYQHQIFIKLMRAVSGKIDENSMEVEEEIPKDSDGSAKVALIGIDRSIMAWMALRGYLPEQKDEIIDILVQLDRLRKNIEKHFPHARAFIRPGFDDIETEQEV